MNTPTVTTFFYGSYINLAVLREVDLVPERTAVARLPGYDISIRPLANLTPSDEHCVYGIVASTTHDELDRLYRHAQEVLGGLYLPHPVTAYLPSGQSEAALCYIALSMLPAPPEPDYVQRIIEPAREHGFPSWYLKRLESFL